MSFYLDFTYFFEIIFMMKFSKLLIAIFLFTSMNSFSASNFMEFGDVNFGRDFKEKSKWLMTLGGGVMQYPTTLPEFTGEHQSYNEVENYNINGYELGFARDFYLGHQFSLSLGGNIFYAKTLDKTIGKAAEDIDFDYSEARESFNVKSGEVTVAFNYLFDYRIVDVQPFIEFGFGRGESTIKIEYSTLGLTGDDDSSEDYDVEVDEVYNYSRVALGVNFISYKGFMSYFKASVTQMVIAERKTTGESNLRDDTTIISYDLSNNDLSESHTVGTLSVGIGSYF